ncbi:PepSY-associated TM helix domain-containing protein [Mariniflexile litorale]|uniref:PepSY-associated TM helix domain-containing protein n=1 Tax=Mariniflexile litorale TaxID=3045158 RepID=A0AAU7EEK8_9FLAO|nr:PepSY-associated TM helix domain-containing protein [Mariniflexile sp. KMM 9835]MDQ8212290.1 PepSY-associated TM helix domain-containing protein [Mariniflexile sp. KMM 9835]
MIRKKLVKKLHLWLGLSSGLIVCLLCLSGAFFVFAEEIMHAYNAEYLNVPVEEERISADVLVASFKEKHPDEHYFWMNTYNDSTRSFDVISGVLEEGASSPILKITFINPYTGQIIGEDMRSINVFFFLAHFHSQLLLGKVGLWIIRVASLIFLIEIIFGLILWWPRNKNQAKTSFKPKYPASKKRMNYDFHRIYGFYACWILLISVITGLIMSFDWIKKPTLSAFGGYPELVGQTPPSPDFHEKEDFKSLQYMYNQFEETYPKGYKLTLMALPSDTITSQAILVDTDDRFLHLYGDNQILDRYTGKQLRNPLTAKFEKNQDILDASLDIHMGSVGGLPTQILAFIIGLFGASMPVTGFYIWWNRTKKSKHK